MHPFFVDYVWKGGRPFGTEKSDGSGMTYRVITDPYRRRYSIERYFEGQFSEVVYDSLLLDFRKLLPHEQIGWEREICFESPGKTIAWIRNQDDRVILKEEHTVHECRIYCPRGTLLAVQKGTPNEGVTLFDGNEHPVWIQQAGAKPYGGKLLSAHV